MHLRRLQRQDLRPHPGARRRERRNSSSAACFIGRGRAARMSWSERLAAYTDSRDRPRSSSNIVRSAAGISLGDLPRRPRYFASSGSRSAMPSLALVHSGLGRIEIGQVPFVLVGDVLALPGKGGPRHHADDPEPHECRTRTPHESRNIGAPTRGVNLGRESSGRSGRWDRRRRRRRRGRVNAADPLRPLRRGRGDHHGRGAVRRVLRKERGPPVVATRAPSGSGAATRGMARGRR